MDHTKKSTYLFSFDVLRVISILAVILVHQTTTTLQVLDHSITNAPLSLFLNQTARFAVPMLFFVSGFVLELNYKSNFTYLTFFKKRAARILVPYLFWSLLYLMVWKGFSAQTFTNTDFLLHLINGTSGYHLYFIPTLVIFYLLFPLFQRVINFIKKPAFLAFIFILQIIIAFYNYYFQVIPIQESLRVAILTFSLFIIGMGAAHHKDALLKFCSKYIKIVLAALIFLIFGIFIHVFNLTTNASSTKYIYNQYGPLNYFYTFLLAMFVVYLFEKRNYLKKLISYLSKLSFFVFFVHVFILHALWTNTLISINRSQYSSFYFDTGIFLIVSLVSFLLAFLIHKIPYASKITG